MTEHATVPVQVWVDVDEGIAVYVRYLQTVPGVRTHTSCQGGRTYAPYVMASWTADAFARLKREGYTFTDCGAKVDLHGDAWGYIHPPMTVANLGSNNQ